MLILGDGYVFFPGRKRGGEAAEEEGGVAGGGEAGVPLRGGEAGREGRRRDTERHQREDSDAADSAGEASRRGLRLPAAGVAGRARIVRQGGGGID